MPKQFAPLLGRPLYLWSLEAFAGHAMIGEIIVVTPPGLSLTNRDQRATYVTGGDTRSASVAAGLAALDGLNAGDDTPVLIHDAARPGLTQNMITQLLQALETHDAAAPALPVIDALKRQGDRLETVRRDHLYRVQTPQIFRAGTIRKALARHAPDVRDDLEAIEAMGLRVKLIESDTRLDKITYAGDFSIMSQLLAPQPALLPRIGTGFDVHAFEAGDHVMLCGVKITHTHGLKGHSDADVCWHALTDAILGALARGDIGDHFPPSDPQWQDADSGLFLTHALKLTEEAGYVISHADITLILEAPRIKPHREAMRQCTAERLGLPMSAVSVKATTTEGLGFTGRREGIAAQAIVALSPRPGSG